MQESRLELYSSVHIMGLSVLRRRVVVTGLGLVTPLGVGVARIWKKLLDGESGIRKMKSTDELDYSSLPCQVYSYSA